MMHWPSRLSPLLRHPRSGRIVKYCERWGTPPYAERRDHLAFPRGNPRIVVSSGTGWSDAAEGRNCLSSSAISSASPSPVPSSRWNRDENDHCSSSSDYSEDFSVSVSSISSGDSWFT